MSDEARLKAVLRDISEIPPLPEVATQVLKMTNDPNVSAADLNRVISRDEALTANVLKLCNSAYYGLPRVISSITQAIMYLGFQTVRNMVLSSSVNQVFINYDMTPYGFKKNGLPEHSFAAAVAAQYLSRKLRPGLSDTAFTTGLLHDVGKIVLVKHIRQEMGKIEQAHGKVFVNREIEMEIFGLDHAMVGAQIADSWNFPQELTLAIGFHHAPENAQGRPLLAVLTYLANNIVHRLGLGRIDGPANMPISDYCSEATGYSEENIAGICAEIEDSIKSVALPSFQTKR